MGIKRIAGYFISWMIPSHTLVYIILHDFMKWDIIGAYIVSGIISGTVMFPLMRYTTKEPKTEKYQNK